MGKLSLVVWEIPHTKLELCEEHTLCTTSHCMCIIYYIIAIWMSAYAHCTGEGAEYKTKYKVQLPCVIAGYS